MPRWVNQLPLPANFETEDPPPAIAKRSKSIYVTFQTKQIQAGLLSDLKRSIFWDDGWDIFENEKVSIRTNFGG